MRVLICIPCLLTGGTEIQTLNLVEALIRGGHQVTTVCYFEHTPNMVECDRKTDWRNKRNYLFIQGAEANDTD